MSSNRHVDEKVKKELTALYTELNDMNQRNNKIVGAALGLFSPESQAKAKQALGELPEQIETLKKQIRALEEKHQVKTRLDSPSALNNLKK
jgi:polyhydroxyalkanoate synthesis regulator protein